MNKKRKHIREIRLEMWEAGHRDALEAIINVMDSTRKAVKEPIAALDVRAAIDSFADQFIAFIKMKLAENKYVEEHGTEPAQQ